MKSNSPQCIRRQTVPSWTSSLLSVALMLQSALAPAGVFVVNRISDEPDANLADSTCAVATADAAKCTLRAAIQQANQNSDEDLILFAIGTAAGEDGIVTIPVLSALPSITQTLVIDGRTASGYDTGASAVVDAKPRVYINGAGIGGDTADGLRILNSAAAGSEIHALGIIGFPDNGIETSNTSLVWLDGNWIGHRLFSSTQRNWGHGIYLDRCTNCTVGQYFGGDDGDERIGIGNLIGRNGEDGIHVALGNNNVIGGNDIGNGTSISHIGNLGHGIYVGGTNNLIGDYRSFGLLPASSSGNVIRGNGGDGIHVVLGGQTILANGVRESSAAGIRLAASNNRIGEAPGSGNVIVGNGDSGVVIVDGLSSGSNLVARNQIHDNGNRGIHIVAGSDNTLRNNAISGNVDDAIRVDGDDNQLRDNNLGLTGLCVGEPPCLPGIVGNGANGVVLASTGNTVVDNGIWLMDDDGIDVVTGDGNLIAGNSIGTDNSGSSLGNNLGSSAVPQAGIRVRADAGNTMIIGNLVGFNDNGIMLDGSGSGVCGNLVGITENGLSVGNNIEGIYVPGSGNVIGDSSSGCAGNRIGASGSDGIEVRGAANIIRNNLIGGAPESGLGNGAGGVFLYQSGAYLNDVSFNSINNNGNDGLRVAASAGTRNRIEKNSFDFNGGLGIDLGDDGSTANDTNDVDLGTNNLQNFPVITALVGGVGQLSVTYNVDSTNISSVFPLSVDFYLRGIGLKQGRTFLHRDNYTTGGANKTTTVPLPPETASGAIVAMVIDGDGNSSEFSTPSSFTAVPVSADIFQDGFED